MKLRLLLMGVVPAFTATTEPSADVATFFSRCKPLRDIALGKKTASVTDEKNLFWCAGHLDGILEGYRIGLLVRGDLNFAKAKSICPPDNSTDVGLIIVALRELERLGYKNQRHWQPRSLEFFPLSGHVDNLAKRTLCLATYCTQSAAADFNGHYRLVARSLALAA